MTGGPPVFALDFDGVVTDSVDELYDTAFLAAKQLWPTLFQRWTAMPDWLRHSTREVRPVLETGFEGVLMVRILVDAYAASDDDPADSLATAVAKMLEDWNPETMALSMRQSGVTKAQVLEVFSGCRDDMMTNDKEGWLNSTPLYAGVADAMRGIPGPVFIITTKEQRFAQTILQHYGVHLPDDHVYGLGMYRTKLEVLEDLAGRPEHKGHTIHFVEDRYKTLEAIHPQLHGLNVRLYLATWGYNTPAVREAAKAAGIATLLDLTGFHVLLARG